VPILRGTWPGTVSLDERRLNMNLHLPAAMVLLACAGQANAQPMALHDEFFWLGEINKATAVINTDEGLLDKSLTPHIAAGVAKVLKDGN